MGATNDWQVLEHGPLQQLEDNLWTAWGALPGMALRRRMAVVRLGDGRLVIHSAIAMDDAAMAALEALGPLSYLIVPSGYHRLDAPRYAARYPQLQVLCPAAARSAVQKRVAVAGDMDSLPDTEALRWVPLSGVRGGEGVLRVHSGAGRVTLVFNDSVFNHPQVHGFKGAVLRLMGSSGGPRITPLTRLLLLSDRKAFASALRELAQTPGLVRALVSHCDPIDGDVAATLRSLAASL